MVCSAGTHPKKLTRALGKSSNQNSSPCRVLRPHCQDLNANDLKQHMALAYAGTCQAHIQCTAHQLGSEAPVTECSSLRVLVPPLMV